VAAPVDLCDRAIGFAALLVDACRQEQFCGAADLCPYRRIFVGGAGGLGMEKARKRTDDAQTGEPAAKAIRDYERLFTKPRTSLT